MKVSSCILMVFVGVGLSMLLPMGLGRAEQGGGVVPPGGQVDGGDDVSAGKPKHCDSDELQGKSCTAPGNCWNACSFWCTSHQACTNCCNAFYGNYKKECLRWCKETWELDGVPVSP